MKKRHRKRTPVLCDIGLGFVGDWKQVASRNVIFGVMEASPTGNLFDVMGGPGGVDFGIRC